LDDFGIFDRTHLRWFTRDDALDLLRYAGLRPIAVEPRCPGLEGWRLRARQLIAMTPFDRFLPIQYVIAALKE
jgi:hypothetical protein